MKKNALKMAVSTAWLCLLSVTTVILLTGCSEEKQEIKAKGAARPVKLITIKEANQSQDLTYPAILDAVHSTKLAFQVSGRLVQLNVISAQTVQKGDELAVLDKRLFINQMNSTKAQFETAQSDYKRGVTLANNDVISVRELEQLKSKKEVAEASYDSAKKALTDSTLIAPYDAVIAAVPASVQDDVNAGQHILTLFGRGQMEAIVNIPSAIIANVGAQTDRPAYVILDASPDEPIHATFRRANLEADAASQTYEVRFVFTAPKNVNVFPGMNASLLIKFENQSSEHMVSVPIFAIFQEGEQHFVWKVDSDSMKVEKAPITIKEGIGEALTVTSGLNTGDIIVGAGANYLTEGMLVSPWTKS